MSHSLPYISAAFYLQRAVAIAPAVIRVRFTYVPKAADQGASIDATNPSNYSVTGSKLVEVTSVSKVDSDPQSLDVFLNGPLSPGLWSIAASGTIQAFDDSSSLSSPNSITFAVSATKTKGPINGGARSDTAADIIRKHLPPSFAGPAWDSLIEGLALGDSVNWENAQAAFDQLFVSTASGAYLDRRSGDSGIARPAYVGMSDESFSQYAIRTSADKLTPNAILQILETFYGTDAVRARMESGEAEPYRLEDGDSVFIGVDAVPPVEMVFSKQDFSRIGTATAVEIAAALNRRFRELRFPATASTKQDPATLKNRVVVYSQSMGLGSKVYAFGGFANNSLRFPQSLDVPLPNGTIIDISSPSQGVARLTLADFPQPVFADLQPGDRVNVWGDGFHQQNRGTYTVTDVWFEWNGSAWSQWFDVENENVFPQASAEIFDTDDLMFSRPLASSVSGRSGVVVSQTPEGIHVILPATTSAVQRDEFSGAHPNTERRFEVASAEVQPDGTVAISTQTNHFLAVGDLVYLSGAVAKTELPQKSGSSASTTSYCPVSATDEFSYPVGFSFPEGGTVCRTGEGAIIAFGSLGKVARLEFLPWNGHNAVGWGSISDLPDDVLFHTANCFPGSSENVVVIGGKSAGAALNTSYVYDSSEDSWGEISGSSITARYLHTTTPLHTATGEEVLLVYGGKADDSTLATGAFLFDGESFSTVSGLASDPGRVSHAVISVSSTSALIVGGESLSGVLSSCFIYDTGTGLAQCGKLTVARKDFAATRLPSGKVLVVGGIGRNLSNETSNRHIHECEVWDPSSRSWSPAGRLRIARTNPVMQIVDGAVYVFGGTNSDGPVKTVERFDISTGQWSILSSLADAQDSKTAVGATSGSLIAAFSLVKLSVLTPRNTRSGTLAIREPLRVESITGPTALVVSVPPGAYAFLEKALLSAITSEASLFPGPYLFNPYGDLAITATQADLMSHISAGQQYNKIALAAEQALSFPDKEGWICINHGTDQVIGPLRYLGRISDSELMIDYSFKFPFDALVGATITLLSQKGAYVPSRPDQVGALYVTASSYGRVVAQAAIESIVAAGLGDKLRVTVLYPGDKGLGNAGHGTTGQKISDKVAVWGGNDLDSELAQAREEE